MRFEQQAERYINQIQTRRRNPVRPATASIYQSYLDRHILPWMGNLDLKMVENGTAKAFLVELNGSNLAPATINSIFAVVKAVVASAVDENGNELYPRKWNSEFIDLPVIEKSNQDCPIVTSRQVTETLRSVSGQDRALFTLLAASGARIGETLALRVGLDDGVGSFWDPQAGILNIRTTLVNGKVQNGTKTQSGIRQVDLAPEVNDYLRQAGLPTEGFLFQNSLGGAVRVKTAYQHLEKAGIKAGFHSFRRFRITHLEAQNVPRSLAMYWTGHSENDVHGGYIKIGQDLKTRKEWAAKAGIGFELKN